MVILFLAYLFLGVIHSIIIAPTTQMVRERDKIEESKPAYSSPQDLESMYQLNKPMILREFTLLDFFVDHYEIFYTISAILLLIITYKSILNSIIKIPALVIFYFILQIIVMSVGQWINSLVEKRIEK